MKLFIFDMGEVLLLNVGTMRKFASMLGTGKDEMLSDYLRYDAALMDGYMAPEDYYRHLEDKYCTSIAGDPFSDFFRPDVNARMLGYADALRGCGFRCVIGSNTFAPHWEYARIMPGSPFPHFDALYASHEMRMSKPETAFFRIICQREGVPYSETAFIDDNEANIAAAASLGITTLLYSGEDRDERADAFFRRYIRWNRS